MLSVRSLKRSSRIAASDKAIAKSLNTLTVIDSPISANVRDMSAFACINTDAIDYQGEAILASGVEIGNYARNPIVLYEHGKVLAGELPIGTSESPNGELMIERTDRDIHATCYFAQSYPFASQIFGLIDEGVIRATSIQVMPKLKSIYQGTDGKRYPVTEESDLIEWSWCMFGVNPEAVKKSLGFVSESFERAWSLQADRAAIVLSRGSLGGDVLMEPIRKSLLSVIPKAKASSPGADFSKGQKMAGTKHMSRIELKKLTKDELAAIVIKGGDVYDSPTVSQAKSLYEEMTKSPEGPKVEDEAEVKAMSTDDGGMPLEGEAEEKALDADDMDDVEESDDDDAEGDKPLGAKVLGEVFASMKYVVDHVTKAIAPVENETVKSGVEALLTDMQATLDAISGLFASAYPDMPGLAAEVEAPEAEEVESQMKSLLAQHRTAGFRSLGLLGQIQRVAADPSIGEAQRKSLRSIADRMNGLVDEAKKFKAPASGDVVSRAEYDALKAKTEALLEKVEQLVPAS